MEVMCHNPVEVLKFVNRSLETKFPRSIQDDIRYSHPQENQFES